MSVAGMMTPIRSASYRNLQLNAGLLFCGTAITATTAAQLKTAVDAIIAAGDTDVQETLTRIGASSLVMNYVKGCLGITRGGGSFVVNQETRQTEADGVRYRFKGDTFVDSVDAQLTGTVIELTPGNLKRILAGTTRKTGDSSTTRFRYQAYTAIGAVNPYLKHLTWIGDLLDGRYVMIHFNWAMNTSGMNMTFTDKGEATMPFEFHAFQAQVEDYNTAPFDITFLRDVYGLGVKTITAYQDGEKLNTLSPTFDEDTETYTLTVDEPSDAPDAEPSVLRVKLVREDKRAGVQINAYKNNTHLILATSCRIDEETISVVIGNNSGSGAVTAIMPPFKLTYQVVDFFDDGTTVIPAGSGTLYTINVAFEE